MQRRKRRRSDRAGRPAMRSPGRPPATGRAEQQRFWKAIARGLSSEDAAVSCGVSPPVGGRWFREGGGMPPISLAPRSARYLSFAEREEIAILRAQGAGRLVDDEVTRRLTTVWGVGKWTTQMFLIFKLGRPDVMPAGDLGVQEGLRILDGLDERPTPEILMARSEVWRPLRSLAAWYLWRLTDEP